MQLVLPQGVTWLVNVHNVYKSEFQYVHPKYLEGFYHHIISVVYSNSGCSYIVANEAKMCLAN